MISKKDRGMQLLLSSCRSLTSSFSLGNNYQDNSSELNKKRSRQEIYNNEERYEQDAGTKRVKQQINPLTGSAYTPRYYDILTKRKQLPAWEAREQLLKLVEKYQVVILQGETGSGKTTQIPQFLLEYLREKG